MKEILESQRHIIDAVLASIGEAVVIVNPKGRIIRNCNVATEQMFGFQKNELIGEKTSILHINQQFYELFGNQSEAVLNRGEIFKGEFRMRKKDGTIIDTYNTVTPIRKELGWEEGVVSVIRDISDEKESEKQLKKNLEEKAMLLEEMHHRVKNNLAVIASLLYLQMEKAVNKRERECLRVAYSRLQSIALVHEQLYKHAELNAKIDLGSYIPQLIKSIEQTTDSNPKEITTSVKANHISIPLVRAVPTGLLISELLMNAYKHAFIGKNKGHIKVNIASNNETLYLQVSDDGVGLPENFTLDSGSIGMNIIQTLSKQLRGNLEFSSRDNQGTSFSVTFGI